MLYDGATFKQSPNHTVGRHGHTVKAVVLHITAGPAGNEYRSAVSWFLNPASEVSAHFVTGPAGDITQTVDTANTAWANGLSYFARLGEFPKAPGWTWQGAGWYCPHKNFVRPRWKLITQGVNPNYETISIETAGQSGAPIPAAQWGALYALLRWLGLEYPQLLPYVPGETLIGHNMLDNVDRANCPGKAFDLAAIAASVNPPYGEYIVKGTPVYRDSQLTEVSDIYLLPGQKIKIDRVHADQPHDYFRSAAHLADGSGFIDLNAAIKAETK